MKGATEAAAFALKSAWTGDENLDVALGLKTTKLRNGQDGAKFGEREELLGVYRSARRKDIRTMRLLIAQQKRQLTILQNRYTTSSRRLPLDLRHWKTSYVAKRNKSKQFNGAPLQVVTGTQKKRKNRKDSIRAILQSNGMQMPNIRDDRVKADSVITDHGEYFGRDINGNGVSCNETRGEEVVLQIGSVRDDKLGANAPLEAGGTKMSRAAEVIEEISPASHTEEPSIERNESAFSDPYQSRNGVERNGTSSMTGTFDQESHENLLADATVAALRVRIDGQHTLKSDHDKNLSRHVGLMDVDSENTFLEKKTQTLKVKCLGNGSAPSLPRLFKISNQASHSLS